MRSLLKKRPSLDNFLLKRSESEDVNKARGSSLSGIPQSPSLNSRTRLSTVPCSLPEEPASPGPHEEEDFFCASPGVPSRKFDADVLCYGDELRLWATSEYALASLDPSKLSRGASAKTGGYIGVYFKGRKRRGRTGHQPLFCVPPLGESVQGEFYESVFQCVDPRGAHGHGDPVRIGDELLLVDADSHVWNTSTAGVVGYLAPRLRGERGEARVRFTRDISRKRSTQEEGEFFESDPSRPCVRYGDSLWMVSCVVNSKDASHPGGGRAQKREHVLTNYKKETSGLLGGYLTIDARGFALQFTVARTPPAVDVATLGRASHYRLPWQQAAPFQCLDTDQLLVRLSSGAECSVSVADMLTASEQRLWLGATANCTARKLTNADRANSSDSQNGHQGGNLGGVLLEWGFCPDPLSSSKSKPPVLLEQTPVPKKASAQPPAPLENAALTALNAELLAAPIVAAPLVLALFFVLLCAQHARERAVAFVALGAFAIAAHLSFEQTRRKAGEAIAQLLGDQASRAPVPGPVSSSVAESLSPQTLFGEFTLMEWSSDAEHCLLLPPTTPVPHARHADAVAHAVQATHAKVTDKAAASAAASRASSAAATFAESGKGASPEERFAVEELRARLVSKGGVFSQRWLEYGELLRFVLARKKIDERVELFDEAMAWRESRCAVDGDAYVCTLADRHTSGSFGTLERAWCEGRLTPPTWWAFLSSALPFELYGTDRKGLPITYLGLGRMDLSGVSREVSIERLEQKIVIQNDMFIDMARERSTPNNVLHGGVIVIDCDGMGRRHLAEVRIFRRVSAALKVLHPERQVKTFIVRAPRVFSFVWKLIKPMLDARIISKINIIGANESLQPLFDELGKDMVPTILGGTYHLKNPPHDSLVPVGAYNDFLKTNTRS